MEKVEAELGRVALSIAGRDKGKYFVICGVLDERFVLIADGRFHKLSAPKKKNIKHLKLLNKTLLTDKLKNGIKIFDSELYKALKVFNNGDKKEE
ncbi:MAG: RNA-binding protein [Clostridiales bacterium]|jgi:large subunit ribosomal protein L14e|nr:RNA-binding protein [Clostridiales bacterium]